jgi:MoxR-like ATPase
MSTTSTSTTVHNHDRAPEAQPQEFARNVVRRVGRTVVGQEVVVERLLIALLTGGHLLLEGVPGVAKTLLVQSVARAIDLRFGRVQFTVDLLPGDILGGEVLDPRTGLPRVHKGPIFTNLFLADEINRASPKVQSALLEAMQERRVSLGDASHPLPTPFLVIATQNPVEQAGTFELPEAQLDRFMLRHRLGYPSRDDESAIVRRSMALELRRDGDAATPMTQFDALHAGDALHVRDLTRAMEATRDVHVSEVLIRECVELVHRTRTHPDVELGCSPRGAIALVHASRARAFIRGRDYVVPEDLFALAEDALLHRMRLRYEAVAEGKKPTDTLRSILDSLA